MLPLKVFHLVLPHMDDTPPTKSLLLDCFIKETLNVQPTSFPVVDFCFLCPTDMGTCNEPGGRPFSTRTGALFPYHVGDEVTYTCDSCYTGGGTITCLNNGRWSGDVACSGVSPAVFPFILGFCSQKLLYDFLQCKGIPTSVEKWGSDVTNLTCSENFFSSESS